MAQALDFVSCPSNANPTAPSMSVQDRCSLSAARLTDGNAPTLDSVSSPTLTTTGPSIPNDGPRFQIIVTPRSAQLLVPLSNLGTGRFPPLDRTNRTGRLRSSGPVGAPQHRVIYEGPQSVKRVPKAPLAVSCAELRVWIPTDERRRSGSSGNREPGRAVKARPEAARR